MQTGKLSSLRLINFLKQDNRIRGFVLPLGSISIFLAIFVVSSGIGRDNLWVDPMNVILRAMEIDFLDPRTYTMPPLFGHPPLFFLLLRAWLWLAGTSLVSMHLLSIFSTVIAAAFVFRIARDFTRDTFAGIAAALVLAHFGVVQDYAVEVHNYALFLMLAAALLFFFGRWWSRPHSSIYSAGILLSTAAILYTHYYSIYLITALNAYALWLILKNRRDALRWLTLQGVAALLYIPMVVQILGGIEFGLRTGGTVRSDVETLRATIWDNAGTVFDTLLDSHTLVFLTIVLCAGLLLTYRRRSPGGRKFVHNALILLSYVVVSLGFALIVNSVIPSLSARRVIYLAAGIAIVTGCALSFWPRFLRWVALVVLLLIMDLPRSGIPNWRLKEWNYYGLMTQLSRSYLPGDLVYIQFDSKALINTFRFYTRLTLPSDVTLLVPATVTNPYDAPYRTFVVGRYTRENAYNQEYFANEVFWKYVGNRNRFWIIHSTDALYGEADTSWVGKIAGRDFRETQTLRQGWLAASLFTADDIDRPAAPDPATLPEKTALPVSFGDHIELLDFQLDRVIAAPGESIDIRLDWLAKGLSEQSYTVYIHLNREDGTPVSQMDADPTHAGRTLPSLFWAADVPVYDQKLLPISLDVAPGRYDLRIGLYDRNTLARLPVTLPDGTLADGLELARIEIR